MSESGFARSNEAEMQLHAPQAPARPVWPWLLLLAGLALVVVLRWTFATVDGNGRDGQDETTVGTRLTTLALEPLTGNPPPISLADLQGKVTLINFWGTWCGPCIVEFPHMVELEQHFRSEPDFQFLSVSSNFDPRDDQGLAENTAEFLKQQQAEFPTYRDPGGKSTIALVETAKLEGFGYPTTLVVDRAGTIQGVWIGFRPGDERGMRQTIERVLWKQPLGDNATQAEEGATSQNQSPK